MKSFAPLGLFCLLASSHLLATTSAAEEKERHLRQGSNQKRKLLDHGHQHPQPEPAASAPRQAPRQAPPTFPDMDRGRETMVTGGQQHGGGGAYRQPTQQHGVVYASPYPYQDPYKAFPTDRPTPVPTPRPTDRPTPYPTPYPTPFPTRSPTPLPTFAPTPSPTPRPTTQEPSAAPSPAPSPEPSAMPSDSPSETPSTAEPSEEPTISEEPSEEPTVSEEPSEEPTETNEPSETPTMTEEPSETPTNSEEPSESPTEEEATLTLAEFICAVENDTLFGTLCTLITASPVLFAILNNDIFVTVSGLSGVSGLEASRLDAQIRDFPQPMVPNIEIPDGIRNLQTTEARKLTLFAPTNSAFDRLLNRPLNDLYDETDSDVITFFNDIGLDVTDSNVLLSSFLLASTGRNALNEILLTHILSEEVDKSDLICNAEFVSLSGQETVTACLRITPPLTTLAKFQIGPGNTAADKPLLYATDTPASNGILHVVDEVILPELNIPDEVVLPPIGADQDIIVVNSALLAGAPRLHTQEPSASP